MTFSLTKAMNGTFNAVKMTAACSVAVVAALGTTSCINNHGLFYLNTLTSKFQESSNTSAVTAPLVVSNSNDQEGTSLEVFAP